MRVVDLVVTGDLEKSEWTKKIFRGLEMGWGGG